jgi:uncharacterized membrane protein
MGMAMAAISRQLFVWGLPLLLILMSIPLILRLIPPNRFFGVRVPASKYSEESWYRINRVGGSILAASGALTLLLNLLVTHGMIEHGNQLRTLYLTGVDDAVMLLVAIIILIISPKI